MLGRPGREGPTESLKIEVYFGYAGVNEMRQEILKALHSVGRYPIAAVIRKALVSQ